MVGSPIHSPGAELSPQACAAHAAHCRALIAQTRISRVKVMLEHIALTWERVAERLIEEE